MSGFWIPLFPLSGFESWNDPSEKTWFRGPKNPKQISISLFWKVKLMFLIALHKMSWNEFWTFLSLGLKVPKTWKWYKECRKVLRLFLRMTVSFWGDRKLIQRHLSIFVARKQFLHEWVPDSLVPSPQDLGAETTQVRKHGSGVLKIPIKSG